MSSSFPERIAGGARLTAIGLFALILAVLSTAGVEAKPVATLEVDTTVLMSDNPFLTTESKKATGAFQLTARPRIEWQMDPQTDLDARGEMGFRQYSRRYGDFVTGAADVQLRHRRNEYLAVSGRAAYARNLVSDSLAESTDFAVDPRGIRESMDARASVSWNTDSTTGFIGNGGWRQLRYPGSTLLGTTNAYDFGVALNKRLNERTTIGAQVHKTLSHVRNGEDTSVRSLNATAAHRFSGQWYGDVQLGVEWSKLRDPISQARENRAQFNGSANLCYEPSRTSACVRSALRSEVSGLGGLQRELSLSAVIRRRTSETDAIVAEAGYRRARLPAYGATARVFQSSVDYERRIHRNLYLTPGVAYLKRNRLAGEKADAFIVQIGLSIRGVRP